MKEKSAAIMDRQHRVNEGLWLKRSNGRSRFLPPANTQETLDCSAATSVSDNVHLASLGSNVVTFSLGSVELLVGVPTPKPVEEPTPPSTTRIALGTLLVIVVVSAATLTLRWFDWPFLPGEPYRHQSLSKNRSANAHRRTEVVVRAAVADNDTIAEGLEPVFAAKRRKIARSTIVPGVRTLDDELVDTSSSSAEGDSETVVTNHEAFAGSNTARLGLKFEPSALSAEREH